HRHRAADLHEVAGDVPLHAVVEGDDVVPGRAGRQDVPRQRVGTALAPGVGGRRHDLFDQIAAEHVRGGAGLADEGSVVEIGGGQDAVHRPADAQPADQRPRVDPFDAGDVVFAEVVVQTL